ncbi:TCR gamma alternate reading frame protein [Pteropus vampyrus]|uniref:TCR gamma alternate reading frame protein n=1 Tax=Pteropus vampyrus TaxID=132908 RepID=UPI000C879E7A|nr:TCR gamma alternate reading frame protein [Pteropus vampyrus]
MPTAWIVLLSLAWVYGDTKVRISQSQLSFTRRTDRTVHIGCKLSGVHLENAIVHWYQQKEGEPLRRILYGSTNNYKQDKPNSRLETDMKDNGNFYLIINNVVKSDEATYYCAYWGIKIFAEGTKLIVTPPDRRLNSDISPKPTIFLPSIAEINLHKAGTYLCLLEKFFPDVIKVSWKEKDSNTILESQQGDTIKINDTYMKFSWLTVTTKSMNKDHKCIVKHENNKRGVDQEILFPSIMNKERKYKAKYENNKRGVDQEILSSSIKEEVAAINNAKEACLKDESDMLQLQFTNTSAYYTYLLLLLKSMIYFAIIAFCLFRRTAVCGNGKSS